MTQDAVKSQAQQQESAEDVTGRAIQAKDAAFMARVQALLEGKEEPYNGQVAFIVEKLRSLYGRGTSINQQLSMARAQVRELEQAAQRTAGAVEEYLHDLRLFDTRPAVVPTQAKEPQNGVHESNPS